MTVQFSAVSTARGLDCFTVVFGIPMPKNPPNAIEIFFHNVFKLMLRIWAVLFYRLRCHNVDNFPESGRGLVCPNHQSNLDPMLVGVTCRRNIRYLAKKSLFKYQPLKLLQNTLHCIAIDRKRGLGGIKNTIKVLKNEHLVLVFPEGSRSKTGKMQQVKGGFLTLARKTKSPLIPAGIEGAFAACPPDTIIPRFGHVHVAIGKPITAAEMEEMSDEQVIALLEKRIRECVEIARQKREHHVSLNIRERKPKWRLTEPAQQT
jgi:1-acyl-sn-glycerol-3-phosphate acyltransferase